MNGFLRLLTIEWLGSAAISWDQFKTSCKYNAMVDGSDVDLVLAREQVRASPKSGPCQDLEQIDGTD